MTPQALRTRIGNPAFFTVMRNGASTHARTAHIESWSKLGSAQALLLGAEHRDR